MASQRTLKSKVCLVGEKAVGKTSLISRFVTNMFRDKYIVTIGTKVSKRTVTLRRPGDHELVVDMTIWDIMGEKGFRDLLKDAYFYGANGVLAVCDVTRLSTLEDLDDWVDQVVKVVGDVPLYVAVNKTDLGQPAFDESAVIAFAKAYNAPYVFTSAKSGENVEKAFELLAYDMASNQLSWA